MCRTCTVIGGKIRKNAVEITEVKGYNTIIRKRGSM